MAKVTEFESSSTFEERKKESAKILEKFPDRVPVIVERASNGTITNIDKNKFLVPRELSVGQFIAVIRKRIKLTSETAMFVYVDGVLPPTGEAMSKVYEEFKKEDGFLYMTYNGETTFGALE